MADSTTPAPASQPDGLPWEAVVQVLDVFERSGFRKGDDQHVGRAIGRVQRAARIYAGLEDD